RHLSVWFQISPVTSRQKNAIAVYLMKSLISFHVMPPHYCSLTTVICGLWQYEDYQQTLWAGASKLMNIPGSNGCYIRVIRFALLPTASCRIHTTGWWKTMITNCTCTTAWAPHYTSIIDRGVC